MSNPETQKYSRNQENHNITNNPLLKKRGAKALIVAGVTAGSVAGIVALGVSGGHDGQSHTQTVAAEASHDANHVSKAIEAIANRYDAASINNVIDYHRAANSSPEDTVVHVQLGLDRSEDAFGASGNDEGSYYEQYYTNDTVTWEAPKINVRLTDPDNRDFDTETAAEIDESTATPSEDGRYESEINIALPGAGVTEGSTAHLTLDTHAQGNFTSDEADTNSIPVSGTLVYSGGEWQLARGE